MLSVKNLKKKYGNNMVLKDISFEVEKGDRIAIIGPSGCGKSTLLRCLNMIEKPTSGKIIFEGTDLTKENTNITKTREKMGMVFQQFNLFPHLSVLENITLAPIKLKIMSKEEANKKALELLEKIDLKDKSDSYPSQLSGGQKQRVAIIRSLIMEPDIILFDEPTSSLDPEMVHEVLNLIMDIASEGMTMIVVSHEMSFVKKFASKILFIDDGKISFSGNTDEVFKNKDNKRLMDFLAMMNK